MNPSARRRIILGMAAGFGLATALAAPAFASDLVAQWDQQDQDQHRHDRERRDQPPPPRPPQGQAPQGHIPQGQGPQGQGPQGQGPHVLIPPGQPPHAPDRQDQWRHTPGQQQPNQFHRDQGPPPDTGPQPDWRNQGNPPQGNRVDRDHGADQHGAWSGGDHRPDGHDRFGQQGRRFDWNQYQPHQRVPDRDEHRRDFDPQRYHYNAHAEHHYRIGRYHAPRGWAYRQWRFGEFLPEMFWARDYWLDQYWDYGLDDPPYGYVWVRYGDDALLVDVETGEILSAEYGVFADDDGEDYGPSGYDDGDRDARWRQRYAQVYTYDDDSYYRDCRESSDPAGVIAGAVIGGLIGNAAGGHHNRGAGTVAGVILGGAAGAGLTRHLECEDRSYAYDIYSQALNSNQPGSSWPWRNPSNGDHGDVRVGEYYDDPDGFRCATFTQQTWVDGQRERVEGHACQQPDGNWAIVN